MQRALDLDHRFGGKADDPAAKPITPSERPQEEIARSA
jgi:hypothetical protein